jgi:general secretion pathway protein L
MKLGLGGPGLAGIPALAGHAYAWWTGELAALMPRQLRARQQHVLTLSACPSGMTCTVADGRNIDPARITQRDTAALAYAVAMDLVLDENLVLDLLVKLPAAAEPNLRPILSHMMESLVPLPPDALIFDFAIDSRDASAEQIRVAVAVLKKPAVQDILDLQTLIDLPLRTTTIRRRQGPDTRFRFLPRRKTSALWRRSARPRRLLEALTIGLLIAATTLRVAQQTRIDASYDAEIAELRHVAGDAAVQENTIRTALAPIDFLRERMRAPSAQAVLDTLARLLPDSVWITELHIQGDTVELVGFARDAASLIRIIESSKTFGNPKFQAPVTAGDIPERQRFALSLTGRSPGAP